MRNNFQNVILSAAKNPFPTNVILSAAKNPFLNSFFLAFALTACTTTAPKPPAVENPLSEAVIERDALARLDDMGPQGIAMKNNANQRTAFIEDLRRTRTLAADAVKSGVDQNPLFIQRMTAQREHILASMYVESYLKEKTNEAALRKYFQDHRAEFTKHQRSAFHIVTREEVAAKAAISALREPNVNLEILVKEFSPSAPEGAKSGDLGTFTKGQMLKPLEDAIFSTNIGQVYGQPVKTEFGWHAILVTGEVPPKSVTFEEVRDEVEQRYRSDLHREMVSKASAVGVSR